MMDPRQKLRVGVCGCAPVLHGLIHGRTISTSRAYVALPITEIIVPQGRDFISRLRLHAFLDYHPEVNDRFVLEVSRIKPITLPRFGEAFVVGSEMRSDQAWHREVRLDRETLPKTEMIIEILTALIQPIRRSELNRWLATMTPSGWQMPALSEEGRATCQT